MAPAILLMGVFDMNSNDVRLAIVQGNLAKVQNFVEMGELNAVLQYGKYLLK
jgi:hypothetical protein